MTGEVDDSGRALVPVTLESVIDARPVELKAWVDTGFTGELVLPQTIIAALGLSRSAVVRAELGDGSETVLDTYTCRIDWFGELQEIEVIAGAAEVPLLGVGLLRNHRISVDYVSGDVTLA